MCDILCFVVVIGGSGGRMGFCEAILCTFFLRFQECKFYKRCMVTNITLVNLLNNQLHRPLYLNEGLVLGNQKV